MAKYNHFQYKAIPYKINDIIHTEKYNDVTLVLLSTYPDKDELPFADYDHSR